jgi:UDP-N-acetyl-D-mannosaminuronate dehydrogenase
MMYPGFGVGGYCLTKDTVLAEWASRTMFGRDEHLRFSINAINVNDLMPHHTFDLLLRGMNNSVTGKKIAILGASYRNDVDDTRNSPTIALYDYIRKAGGIPEIHDPYAANMEQRKDIKITSDISDVIKGASAVVFVIKHKQYLHLPITMLIEHIEKNACIIDAFNVLSDVKIQELKKNRFVVFGVGKGHIKNI